MRIPAREIEPAQLLTEKGVMRHEEEWPVAAGERFERADHNQGEHACDHQECADCRDVAAASIDPARDVAVQIQRNRARARQRSVRRATGATSLYSHSGASLVMSLARASSR